MNPEGQTVHHDRARMVRFDHVSVSFDHQVVLSDVVLSVGEGEFVSEKHQRARHRGHPGHP
ncbi:MAG TPA: hypothetical protein VES59_06120 [Bacteroidota bacterium]|nr:hypothetical protein [Bacteroidota bacterium]